ncbi:MAG: lipoprotein, partial [Lachnospiraceae bacterium]|nr:lipoprotein [Lachnospiraceae bacterium]
MYNRMKKYIFLALLTMGVSSCQLVDVLDQKPEFEADL